MDNLPRLGFCIVVSTVRWKVAIEVRLTLCALSTSSLAAQGFSLPAMLCG